MPIYYVSSETNEFFFSSDHIQSEREGQNIPEHFVPVTNRCYTFGDIRDQLIKAGNREIPNPDPAFQPQFYIYKHPYEKQIFS
jgi:hypothetical protein